MTGPTLHALVEHNRIEGLREQTRKTADTMAREVTDELGRQINHGISEAYRRGVLDGFAQSCIAEAASHVVSEPTCWPTIDCTKCGYVHGPFPDDASGAAAIRAMRDHDAWCPATKGDAEPES